MSDFDKEAERERLREKFERDEKKREATQRMSELLLQGATMTNRHCGDCGDPVFRYEGEEFCPTCQRRMGDDAERSADSGAVDANPAGADPTGANPPQTGGGPDVEPQAAETADPVDVTPAEAGARDPREDASGSADGTAGAGTGTGARAGTPTVDAPAGEDDGVAAARESLVRTLVKFSEAASETDDPRRARRRLAAAREAAEALAALER